jgi:hypothetical protein
MVFLRPSLTPFLAVHTTGGVHGLAAFMAWQCHGRRRWMSLSVTDGEVGSQARTLRVCARPRRWRPLPPRHPSANG